METQVVVQCRACDVPLVRAAIEGAASAYSTSLKTETVQATIDEANPLPPSR